METTRIRRAAAADIDAIVGMMRQYYHEDSYPFVEEAARAAAAELIETETLGWLWMLEADHEIVGYAAVTLGFSLEYRGRDAFIDEIYVLPSARGRGLGSMAIDAAVAACRTRGVKALHLEVERHKGAAHELYRRKGFEDHNRYLMTKHLDDDPERRGAGTCIS